MLGEALHKGCTQDDLLFVSTLLNQQDINIDGKDKQGRTALHLAAGDSNHLMAQLLLQHGASTTVVSNSGRIPLDCASDGEMILLLARYMVKEGNEQLLQEKLEHMNKPKKIKQKINKQIQKFPPEKRILPALTGFLSKLKLMDVMNIKECDSAKSSLTNVSDASIYDSGYMGMDVEASSVNHLESKRTSATPEIIDKERRKTSPITKKELNSIESLRNKDLRETKQQPKKSTIVRRQTHPTQNASILRSNNANTQTKKQVRFSSEVLLDLAIVNDEFVETCHLIKTTGVDINRPGPNGLTPLHRAAIEGSYDCLQLLIDQGAEVNLCDEHGWTPLHDAVYHGNISCVAALLKAGANVNILTHNMYSILELADTEDMLFLVGRALVLYEFGLVAHIGEEVVLNISDRESCV